MVKLSINNVSMTKLKALWNDTTNQQQTKTKQLFRILLISLFYICEFIFLLLLFPLLFYQLFLFIPVINVILDSSHHITMHGSPWLTWWGCPDPSSASCSASASPPCAEETPRGYRMSSQTPGSRSEWTDEIKLTLFGSDRSPVNANLRPFVRWKLV